MHPIPPTPEISDYLKDQLSTYYQMLNVSQDIRTSISSPQGDDIADFLGDDFSWSIYYEKSFQDTWMTIIFLADFISFKKPIHFTIPASNIEDIISATVAATRLPPEADPTKIKLQYLGMIIAVINSIESLMLYGRSISSLVIETDCGDDESMFKALTIDPTSINCPTFSKRLQKAYLESDENFFKRMRKSLNKKPTKLVNEYRELRLMLYRLESHGFIKDLTEESAYQIFCENLDLYPSDGDAARSLWKFITRWKETRRHEKEFSCRGPDY
jgi:hypothetical protein